MLVMTQDGFGALGRELVDMAIARYTQALADHAQTVGVPAPTDHPLIERIVKQHGGQYAVLPAGVQPVAERLRAVEMDLNVRDRIEALEARFGLEAKGTIDERAGAIEGAAATLLTVEAVKA